MLGVLASVGGPPLPRAPLGIPFRATTATAAASKLVVECYHDVCCPFSRKMFETLFSGDKPLASKQAAVEFRWHPVPQPWHPQSAIMTESALAVHQAEPDKLWPYLVSLYAQQESFFDDKVQHLSRDALYSMCARVASDVGVDGAGFKKQLALEGEGNCGNRVTQAMKFYCKEHRKRGVHVTPTVFVNGMEAPQASSGWGAAEWETFLADLTE